MEVFKKRVSVPSKSNKYYLHYNKGGYNTCMVIDAKTGEVMPNCVGYSNGRLQELNGKTKVDWRIPAGNPNTWIATAKKNGLKTGTSPKLGAVIVWENHVANIEAIDKNGNITISQSHYKGTYFDTMVLSKASKYEYYGQKVLGYVYADKNYGTGAYTDTPKVETKASYYVQTGSYTNKVYAKKQQTDLARHGFTSLVKYDGKYYRIQTGAFTSRTEAETLVAKLKSKTFSSFIATEIAGKEVKL